MRYLPDVTPSASGKQYSPLTMGHPVFFRGLDVFSSGTNITAASSSGFPSKVTVPCSSMGEGWHPVPSSRMEATDARIRILIFLIRDMDRIGIVAFCQILEGVGGCRLRNKVNRSVDHEHVDAADVVASKGVPFQRKYEDSVCIEDAR